MVVCICQCCSPSSSHPPRSKVLNLFPLPSFQPPVVKTKAQLDVIKNKGLGGTSSLFLVSRLLVFSFYQCIQAFSLCMMSFWSCELIFQVLSRQPQVCWYRRISTAHLPAEVLGTIVWTSPMALPFTLG